VVQRQSQIQGTVKHFDEAARTGSLLTDDRAEIAIDERSIVDETIRMLRIGQRVKFRVEDAEGGSVARDLRIVTFD
jgi:cold shock CspA family protein